MPAGSVAPVFPFEPIVNQASEYGDLVTAADFADAAALAGHAFDEDTAPQDDSPAARAGLRGLQGDQGAGVVEDAPTKVVVTKLAVPLLCGIHTFDFAGVADGRSLRNTLIAMRPRRCVLVGCPDDSTVGLSAGMEPSPVVPKPGERVDLSAATPSFLVSLDASLGDLQLAPSGAEGAYNVGWLDSVLQVHAADEKQPAKARATLTAPPPGAEPRPHAAARVGDARLSDLLTACNAAGIPAQFSAGGVLMAAGGVTVRKGEGEELLLEGSLSDTYYRVMAVINSQYQAV
jgi:cleavage and polyadenylation specificity factor subunit 2